MKEWIKPLYLIEYRHGLTVANRYQQAILDRVKPMHLHTTDSPSAVLANLEQWATHDRLVRYRRCHAVQFYMRKEARMCDVAIMVMDISDKRGPIVSIRFLLIGQPLPDSLT